MPDRAAMPGQSENSGCPFFISNELTPRELEALSLAAQGHTAYGIGLQMRISERTVKAHWQAARDKLGALTTTHAVAIALGRQLIDTVTVH